MNKSKTGPRRQTRGSVCIVATTTSRHKSGSLGVPEHHRKAAVTVENVEADIMAMVKALGRPPTHREYENHGVYGYSTTFKYRGLRFFLRALGFTVSRRTQSKNSLVQSSFRCLNGVDCSAPDPPNPVKTKQTYCDYCKTDRGWYD